MAGSNISLDGIKSDTRSAAERPNCDDFTVELPTGRFVLRHSCSRDSDVQRFQAELQAELLNSCVHAPLVKIPAELRSRVHAPLAELRSPSHASLAEPRSLRSHSLASLAELRSHYHASLAAVCSGFHEGDPLAKFFSGLHVPLAKPYSGFHEGYSLAKPHGRFYVLSNQGESSGSGGRSGEERNGGGGDGNQGIGGGVGGGGQRESIGNEGRGSRGRSHGGGNGDDDDNDRRGWLGFIVDGRRPMGPRPDRMPEILLPFNFQLFATVESLDVTGLSVRVRIVRVVSLGFTSVALVCLSASIRQRGTNPRLASILSSIGSVATFLGFITMIAMALLASWIP